MPRNRRRASGNEGRPPGLQAPVGLQTLATEEAEKAGGDSKFTDVKFKSLPLLADTLSALDKMGYTNCTTIQAASLPVNLSGVDVLCKARTGTGKTLAFLIPAIEQLKRTKPVSKNSISILVISPTRELAFQIEKEAKALANAHNLITQSVVGGTNAATDMSKIKSRTPAILVATPGRLIDLIENTGLKMHLQELRTFVLDEADRLLDMGFKPSIDRIMGHLPPPAYRQNVMFSATYPENIQRLCKDVLRPQFEIVDTVGETSIQTAEKVDQSVIVSTTNQQVADLMHILRKHQKEDPSFKAMVFYPTARMTGLYAELFTAMGFPALELHSRKSQGYRTRVAEQFRKGKNLILFSSDVSARGVDYPDVSLVVQVGMPSDRDQYIHRVGRTARAGKKGQAVLIISDFEQRFLNSLKDLPVRRTPLLSQQGELASLQDGIQKGLSKLPKATKNQAFQAWLGYYNTYKKFLGWSAQELVAQANLFAREGLGSDEPMGLSKKTARKMALAGTPGLLIKEEDGGGKRANTFEKQGSRGDKGGKSSQLRSPGKKARY